MNAFLGKILLTFFVFMLAFSIFGQTTTTAIQDPIRTLVPPQAPMCEKSDKGYCQAVCNVARNSDGTSNPAGCVTAFTPMQPQGILCRLDQTTILIGCDMPSADSCVSSSGQQGVWCSCYYRCQDLPSPRQGE
ncbi:MAG TPA: hypothetical protein VJH37_03445 [Candidatus Nanoarchaeia archaeon]|nr:hypothetical protein [Candidatus Nanoarchaeia archaeon]